MLHSCDWKCKVIENYYVCKTYLGFFVGVSFCTFSSHVGPLINKNSNISTFEVYVNCLLVSGECNKMGISNRKSCFTPFSPKSGKSVTLMSHRKERKKWISEWNQPWEPLEVQVSLRRLGMCQPKKRDLCLFLCIWLVVFLYFRNLLNKESKNIFVPLIYCPFMDRPGVLMYWHC